MKAIVFAAGPAKPGFYEGAESSFLRIYQNKITEEVKPFHPPKCLFKFRGEIILERLVRILRAHGIEQVKVVVNYKKEEIEAFNREKNLGLELIYNPYWKEMLNVFRMVLEEDDDYLVIFGDSYMTDNAIEKVMQVEGYAMVDAKTDTCIFKIPKGKVKEFLYEYGMIRRCPICNWEPTGSCFHCGMTNLNFLFEEKFDFTRIKDDGLVDLDIYEWTDDFKERFPFEIRNRYLFEAGFGYVAREKFSN